MTLNYWCALDANGQVLRQNIEAVAAPDAADEGAAAIEAQPGWQSPGHVRTGPGAWALVAPVPASVTPAQIRLAILNTPGLQPVLDTYVAAMDAETRIRWDYAISVSRHDPAVIAAAAWAGLSDAQLDQLFVRAASFS